MTIHRRESYQFQEFQTSETTREVSPVSSSLPVSSVALAGHLQAYPLRPVPKRVGWTMNKFCRRQATLLRHRTPSILFAAPSVAKLTGPRESLV